MESIVFARDVAVLAAQIGPVLVIAFIVEFRALAERRSIEGGDVRGLLWVVFASLAVLLAVCLIIVNTETDLRGLPAAWAWALVVTSLSLLVIYVALAGWAAVRTATDDSEEARLRNDALEQRLRMPGWKWLLRSQPAPLHVVAAVIEDQGKILACRRAPGKAAAGKWEFPGGKVEKGEQPGEALIREIREELGARVRIIELVASDVTDVNRVALRLTCFRVKVLGPKPTSSADHDELRWVRRADLIHLDWAKPDLPAVRALMKEERSPRTRRRRARSE